MLVTATGWTIRELDATPWPDVLDLLDYWSECPPLHLMVKAYLGIKAPKEEKTMTTDEFMQGLKGFGL